MNPGYEKSKNKLRLVADAQHEEAILRWQKTGARCAYCRAELPYAKRYNSTCNRICARRLEASQRTYVRIVRSCKMCGEVRKKGNAAYCSLACDVNFRWEQKKKEILHKIELGLAINPARLKKYLLEVRGNKCEICGISEYLDLPVLMIMDHINGDGLDNRLENLRLVCPICDTRLPTYKSKNYGKGRVKKRLHQQRVAESHRIP